MKVNSTLPTVNCTLLSLSRSLRRLARLVSPPILLSPCTEEPSSLVPSSFLSLPSGLDSSKKDVFLMHTEAEDDLMLRIGSLGAGPSCSFTEIPAGRLSPENEVEPSLLLSSLVLAIGDSAVGDTFCLSPTRLIVACNLASPHPPLLLSFRFPAAARALLRVSVFCRSC